MNEENHRLFGIDVLIIHSLIFPLRKKYEETLYQILYISNLVFPVKRIINYSA